ncbi:hypothetical protein PILCRDRAFT_595603 [Piloderma croceum F 1598]|uniref:Uncharacterized protein n=1 Tax=Piloderma croceum (strain F 1598) TaxID=765440 RepID=A0A0C3FEE1_PILCF|nr:hypothetical protein PILCRDRAFT_595603 [Piloderma croceum F 1598]
MGGNLDGSGSSFVFRCNPSGLICYIVSHVIYLPSHFDLTSLTKLTLLVAGIRQTWGAGGAGRAACVGPVSMLVIPTPMFSYSPRSRSRVPPRYFIFAEIACLSSSVCALPVILSRSNIRISIA